MIKDLQELIESEKGLNEKGADFFSSYHTADEVFDWMKALTANHTDLVDLISIGQTFEGRNIWGFKISSNSSYLNKPNVVFHGAEHAREWISAAVVSYMANELITQYGKDAEITNLLDAFDFTIIPILNIDGYRYSHEKDRMWRKNRQPNAFCTGTDMNRNWGFKWEGKGSSAFPCSEVYRGKEPFSAPETQSMRDYLASLNNVVSYIDFHAYSQLWMYPWGFSCSNKSPDYKKQKQVADAAVNAIEKINNVKFTAFQTFKKVNGDSIDYAYATLNITYSYAVELRDTGRYGFMLPPEYIVPSGKETFAGLKAMLNEIVKLSQ
ncbi:Peptidase M14, carboxypeptidase A domain-containing protein [Rozella allomycis CSF55]|uniref:Carboxypeptidase M14A n=1 Tax=Rozella allomycis (strain CSF55) TaxID=988480 RepID=A0A075AVN7_ROZAC|nr:Peptidase M14, carboxypeptidase A domain-containing protein [Rozella allomycis CSF55]|eukprot:EPZ32777.1 Peptidase M14, carboxypeptidase A domain-containing protein [Rozella allomycis CSF55]